MNFSFTSKSGKKILVREPRIEDLDEALLFINELVEEDTYILINKKQTEEEEKEYLIGLIKSIENKDKLTLFAFVDGKLIANTGVERQKYRAEHVGLVGISVKEGYREDGIGTIMLNKLIQEARNTLGLKLLTLTVFSNNPRAKNLYHKVGFKETGVIPKSIYYKGKYIDQIMMFKEL